MIIYWNARTNPQVILAESIWSFPTLTSYEITAVEEEAVKGSMLAARHVRRVMHRHRKGYFRG